MMVVNSDGSERAPSRIGDDIVVWRPSQPSSINNDINKSSRKLPNGQPTNRPEARRRLSAPSGRFSKGFQPPSEQDQLRAIIVDLRSDLVKANQTLEAERKSCKQLRRDLNLQIRNAGEEEAKKHELALVELKNRLQHEKVQALHQQQQGLERKFENELRRMMNQKEEEVRRTFTEEIKLREEIIREMKQQQRALIADSTQESRHGSAYVDTSHWVEKHMQKSHPMLQDDDHRAILENFHAEINRMSEAQAQEIEGIQASHQAVINKMNKDMEFKDRELIAMNEKLNQSQLEKAQLQQQSEWISSQKERKLTLRLTALQEKLKRQEQVNRRLRTEKEAEAKKLQKAASEKEKELKEKLNKLSTEYQQVKSNLLRKVLETENMVAPLRKKQRQFVSRNIELTGRNRQLESEIGHLRTGEKTDRTEKPARKAGSKSISGPEADSAEDYAELYTHLVKEYTELQRSYQLLQAKIQPSDKDPQRADRDLSELENKLLVSEATVNDLKSAINSECTEAKLIEEKADLMALNLGLSERIRHLCQKEERLLSELQEVRDQSELLEFRVLELEQLQEKAGKSKGVDAETETDPELLSHDPGYYSANSSIVGEDEIRELQRDFRSEKVCETQERLGKLVREVEGVASKSLLLQTVALFECLIGKVTELQDKNDQLLKERETEFLGVTEAQRENEETKKELESVQSELEKMGSHVAELEAAIASLRTIETKLVEEKGLLEAELESTKRANEEEEKRRGEVARRMKERQDQVEQDLRKQINSLNKKLETTLQGCQSESLMHEESVLKTATLEKNLSDIQERVRDLEKENTELKLQVSNNIVVDANHDKAEGCVTCSGGQIDPLLSPASRGQKSSSSGIGSDVSDSETENSSLRSRSTSPEKAMTKYDEGHALIYEASHYTSSFTQTGEDYFQEISSLTEEIKKLGKFKEMMEETRGQANFHEVHSTEPSTKKLDDPDHDYEHEVSAMNHKNNFSPLEIAVRQEVIPEQNALRLNLELEVVRLGEELGRTTADKSKLELRIKELIQQLEESEEEKYGLDQRLQSVLEEKIELEELENDSRLKSQQLEQNVKNLETRLLGMKEELMVERKSMKHMRTELQIAGEKEDTATNEIGYLEDLLARYETQLSASERREDNLRSALQSLVTGVTLWSYVHHNKFCLTADPALATGYRWITLLLSVGHRRPLALETTLTASDVSRAEITEIQASQLEDDNVMDEAAQLSSVETVVFSTNYSEDLETENEMLRHALEAILHEKHSCEELIAKKDERVNVLEDKMADLLTSSREKETELNMKLGSTEETVNRQTVKISSLEERLERMRSELSAISMEELMDEENELEEFSSGAFHSFTTKIDQTEDEEMITKIRKLIEIEKRLKEELEDHEKKEAAFRETVAEADIYMSKMEYKYREKVAELEEERDRLNQSLSFYRGQEDRLKNELMAVAAAVESGTVVGGDDAEDSGTAGATDDQSEDSEPVSLERVNSNRESIQLFLQRICETEKSEHELKDKVYLLEKREGELTQKLQEETRRANNLRLEIKELEDMLHHMDDVQNDNRRLQNENKRIKELEFRVQELLQSGEFLQGRVEELELVESKIRGTLADKVQALANRDKRIVELEDRVREERQKLKASESSYVTSFDMLRDEDDSLRLVVDNMKTRINSLKSELQQKEQDYSEAESSLRNEVHKTRQQLHQSHQQLQEMECINTQLRSNLSAVEAQLEEKTEAATKISRTAEEASFQLSQRIQDQEVTISKLKLQLEAKMSSLGFSPVQKAEMTAITSTPIGSRLFHLTGSRDSGVAGDHDSDDSSSGAHHPTVRSLGLGKELEELDNLAVREGDLATISREVAALSKSLMACPTCSSNRNADRLTGVAGQLSMLSQLVSGFDNRAVGFGAFDFGGGHKIGLSEVSSQSLSSLQLLARCESEEQLDSFLLDTSNAGSDKVAGNKGSNGENRPVNGTSKMASDLEDDMPLISFHAELKAMSLKDDIRGGVDMDDEIMLEKQLEELQEKLERMENEMNIVSDESKELADRVQAREMEILRKTCEIRDFERLVEQLRMANIRCEDARQKNAARLDVLEDRLKVADKKIRVKNTVIAALLVAAHSSAPHSAHADGCFGRLTANSFKAALHCFKAVVVNSGGGLGDGAGNGSLLGKGSAGGVSHVERRRCLLSKARLGLNSSPSGLGLEEVLKIVEKGCLVNEASKTSELADANTRKNSVNTIKEEPEESEDGKINSNTSESGALSETSSIVSGRSALVKPQAQSQPKPEVLNVDPKILPPENFRITRKVGSDGLLVAWSTPEDEDVTGYQIFIDGSMFQKVRSFTRTKALLHGLDLEHPMKISIHSVCDGDRVSVSSSIEYSPDVELRQPDRSKQFGGRQIRYRNSLSDFAGLQALNQQQPPLPPPVQQQPPRSPQPAQQTSGGDGDDEVVLRKKGGNAGNRGSSNRQGSRHSLGTVSGDFYNLTGWDNFKSDAKSRPQGQGDAGRGQL